MLVLTRKTGECIVVGDNIKVVISGVSGNRVKVCIDAPKECAIRRGEIALDQKAGAPAERPCRIPAGAVAR